MKTTLLKIALLTMGVMGSQMALAQVVSSKHNLGITSNGLTSTVKFTGATGTTEVCVFCHTPHGASITAVVPLWNRTLNTATVYQQYTALGTSSLDGGTAPLASVSMACLSCHDGGAAVNVMINSPGSGTVAGGIGTWAGDTRVTAGGLIIGTANISTDLRNDHPIGIQYGGGLATGTTSAFPAGAVANTLFKDVEYNSLAGLGTTWWVNAPGGTASREKTDLLLYTRVGATLTLPGGTTTTVVSAGAQPYVECASCHDAHSSASLFLRSPMAGSALCLACHIK